MLDSFRYTEETKFGVAKAAVYAFMRCVGLSEGRGGNDLRPPHSRLGRVGGRLGLLDLDAVNRLEGTPR